MYGLVKSSRESSENENFILDLNTYSITAVGE